MLNKFYKVDYAPNKLAYVIKKTKTDIHFLTFFNEGTGLKAIEHSVSLKSKGDFKKIDECFKPNEKVIELINSFGK